MALLTLMVPLLVASVGECYLVTNAGIDRIPCDFSAAATDALRYAAKDAARATPPRTEPVQRPGAAVRWSPAPPRAFEGAPRGGSRR